MSIDLLFNQLKEYTLHFLLFSHYTLSSNMCFIFFLLSYFPIKGIQKLFKHLKMLLLIIRHNLLYCLIFFKACCKTLWSFSVKFIDFLSASKGKPFKWEDIRENWFLQSSSSFSGCFESFSSWILDFPWSNNFLWHN